MTFYHEQPETMKIYQVTCEMVSHTSIFQFLNKIIYGIQFTQIENQQQEFSKRHQDNLKFHLKKDLIHYLAPKQTYDQNYQNYLRGFTQDCCSHKNMINSNTDALNHFQQYNANVLPSDQSFISQQDNSYGFKMEEIVTIKVIITIIIFNLSIINLLILQLLLIL